MNSRVGREVHMGDECGYLFELFPGAENEHGSFFVPGNAEVVIIQNGTGEPMTVHIMAEDMQPCIGTETHTGMSYGRFELRDSSLKRIIIDGVNVVCLPHESNPAFSVGAYGYKSVPEIKCINGGTIQCPEMTGTRFFRNDIIKHEGSTKLTGKASYYIVRPGESVDKYFSDEQLEVLKQIQQITHEYDDKITPEFPVKALKSLLEVSKYVIVNDISYWNNGLNSATYFMTLRTCALLGMDYGNADGTEFLFESLKMDNFILCHFNDPKDRDVVNCAIIVMGYIFATEESEELKWEKCYEVIPSYFWDFKPGDRTHQEEVIMFMNQKTKQEIFDSADFQNLTDDNIREGFRAAMYEPVV